MYLFCAQTDGEVDDWRKGKHNFRQANGGQSGVLSNEFDEGMTRKVARIVTKEKVRGDARFQRISWWYPSRPTVILIQVQLQYTVLFMKKTPYMCLDMLKPNFIQICMISSPILHGQIRNITVRWKRGSVTASGPWEFQERA